MYYTKNLTPTNGFDFKDLNNARQNNYAWCISELDNYIYVGTGRNIAYGALTNFVGDIEAPISVSPLIPDMNAEIWRYKKDCSLPWNRVYKSDSNISGFRAMIKHAPLNAAPYLYAAGISSSVTILKSTNGVDWYQLDNININGTSSRSMVSYRGKLYIATIDDLSSDNNPYLYSSIDPELYPLELVTDSSNPNYIKGKNPEGSILEMAVFNDNIYLATSLPDGIQVWRTNSCEPKLNDWTLIGDKGFGDSANTNCLSMGVFKNHLYLSAIKSLPLAFAIPEGSDLIRISKNDYWEVVVGGYPISPSVPSKGSRNRSLSGLNSGFNNRFNVYMWQIQEFNNKLLITTFDDSSNMKLILDTLIINRSLLSTSIDTRIIDTLIKIYTSIVKLLSKIKYPFGFDLYESSDGINFKPIFLNGLKNSNNYGGRTLFLDCKNNLYLGTANPFEGCEVHQIKSTPKYNNYCTNHKCFYDFKNEKAELDKLFAALNTILPKLNLNPS